MRLSVLSALLVSAASAFAQSAAVSTQLTRDTATQPAVNDSATAPGTASNARLRAQLSILRLMGYTATLPTVDQFSSGNRTIPAGTAVSGPIGVVDGSLDVFGTINGATMVVDGNLRLHPGATINGDAITVRGRINNQGGVVTGESRSLGTFATGAEKRVEPPRTTMWALKLTLGWFAVLVIIGVGVMIFAEANLDGVVLALERGVGRAFGAGVLGQLVALPVLALLCVALALTIIGILLIPFAIVAYTIAIAGLVTLGFLAVSRLSGSPLVSAPDLTPRGVNLRAMFVGLIGYFALWALAAAFTWHPMIGTVLRMIALVVTWVAATAGLGATLLSRAGTRRPGRRKSRTAASDDYSWQTPTPVSGVAAGTRRK
ncbi:MAG TPA: hypothetical protein VFO55_00435 [Gemmatimonadaceae bacterium]|nr:hypothetical protein [Gemmatimonadaceae bacterium]